MKCSPGLAPALGGQCGQGCASGGLVKELGDGSAWLEKQGWKLFLGLAARDWLGTSFGQRALKQGAVARWAESQRSLCWTDRSGEELFLADCLAQTSLSLPQPPGFAPFALRRASLCKHQMCCEIADHPKQSFVLDFSEG